MFGLIKSKNVFTGKTVPGLYHTPNGKVVVSRNGKEWEVYRNDDHSVTTIFDTLREAAPFAHSES